MAPVRRSRDLALPNVDHNPYNNALGFDVASIAWSMFQRHPLK